MFLQILSHLLLGAAFSDIHLLHITQHVNCCKLPGLQCQDKKEGFPEPHLSNNCMQLP